MIDNAVLIVGLMLSGALCGLTFTYALDTGKWFGFAISVAIAIGTSKQVVNEAFREGKEE